MRRRCFPLEIKSSTRPALGIPREVQRVGISLIASHLRSHAIVTIQGSKVTSLTLHSLCHKTRGSLKLNLQTEAGLTEQRHMQSMV